MHVQHFHHLVIKTPQCIYGARHRVQRHKGVHRGAHDDAVHEPVGDFAIVAQIRVAGLHRGDVRARGVVLHHGNFIHGLRKVRGVVVHVGEPDGVLGDLPQRGRPEVLGHDRQVVLADPLPVQHGRGHDHVAVLVRLAQLEVVVSEQGAVDLAVHTRVPVQGADQRHQAVPLRRLADVRDARGDGGHGGDADLRGIVVHVGDVDDDFAHGGARVGPQVGGLHVQLVGAFVLEIHGAPERQAARFTIHVEKFSDLAGDLLPEPVRHLPVRTLVRVHCVQAQDDRANRRVLGQTHREAVLVKNGAIVVKVRHPDVDLCWPRSVRVPPVRGHQLHGVWRLSLPV